MANFLHGVETIELSSGPRPVSVVKSAVIGLIGIAPNGPTQELTLVQSSTDAAQFGGLVPGFNIPRALDSIFKQGYGTVIVINVFNSAAHTVPVVDEDNTVVNGKFRTAFPPMGSLAITSNDDTPVVYQKNVDFTFDEFGVVTIIPGSAIAEGDILLSDYRRLSPDLVTDAALIGTVDSEEGIRTGQFLYEICYSTFGFTPRIFIAPGYSGSPAIALDLINQANTYRGHCLIDADSAVSPSMILAQRGPLAEDSNIATSDKRAILLYPAVKVYDPYDNDIVETPYSQFMAGVIAATDNNEGYWVSPSNHEIKGIVGPSRIITSSITGLGTDANMLNEAGFVTIFNSFGTGLRVWGNRSASFPTSTEPTNFISVQRTADILHESIERATLPFLDKPINNGLIDSIRDTVNGFIGTLIQRGALVDGDCNFDNSLNPPEQIAAGQIVFTVTFMPPTPAERITFQSFIDITLLSSIVASN